jgi:hypothetical protein
MSRRSGVAEKPQAAAIRAEGLDRELIVTGSARSVGRGATIRSRGTARGDYWDARREPHVGVGGMRSYGWRSQATRATALAAPSAALRDGAIQIATRSTPAALSRAALLGSVWLGALAMLAPNAAHAVDGTWTAPPPNPKEWTLGTNWSSSPNPPDNIATFTNNGAATSVTISSSTSINTI